MDFGLGSSSSGNQLRAASAVRSRRKFLELVELLYRDSTDIHCGAYSDFFSCAFINMHIDTLRFCLSEAFLVPKEQSLNNEILYHLFFLFSSYSGCTSKKISLNLLPEVVEEFVLTLSSTLIEDSGVGFVCSSGFLVHPSQQFGQYVCPQLKERINEIENVESLLPV